MKTILVAGGTGFIGSAVIRQYIKETDYEVINLDALSYAGNLESLSSVETNDTTKLSADYKITLPNWEDHVEKAVFEALSSSVV